jgi:hypothetical protein
MVEPASPVPVTLVSALVVVPLLAMVVVLTVSKTPLMTGTAPHRSAVTAFVVVVPSLPAASTTLAV